MTGGVTVKMPCEIHPDHAADDRCGYCEDCGLHCLIEVDADDDGKAVTFLSHASAVDDDHTPMAFMQASPVNETIVEYVTRAATLIVYAIDNA